MTTISEWKPLCGHPAPGLDGVADRVAGAVIEIDAAFDQAAPSRIEAGDLVEGGALVDARDEEAAGIALAEQLDGVADALRAAGERHDAVGARRRVLLVTLDRLQEDAEAADGHDGESERGEGCDLDQPPKQAHAR